MWPVATVEHHCSRCHAWLPVGQPNGHCPTCRQLIRAKAVKVWQAQQAWLVSLKRKGCQHCGSLADLHFHHRNPATLKFRVGSANRNTSWTALRAEVAKCDILCAACHQLEHQS